jgi:hypothetical protein
MIKILCFLFLLGWMAFAPALDLESLTFKTIDRLPVIDPDYTQIVIPPNIAPLNFIICEKGKQFAVKIASQSGKPILLSGKKPEIGIPETAWRTLLQNNRGQDLVLDIYVQNSAGEWTRYAPIKNHIAAEEIDSYLFYRSFTPLYNNWTQMGIFQRNLENFDEDPLLVNRLTEDNCMNCHNFKANDPDNMVLHLRGGPANGTLMIHDGRAVKIDTKTAFNRAGAYPSWHPSGKAIAFSVNNLTMFFHNIGEPREVLDAGSDLILYLIEKNMVTTCPAVSDPERMETFPNWSPDGKELYFCSSPKMENYLVNENGKQDLNYKQIKYDLERIPYNIETGVWGERETLISASKTGLSVAIPRVSPDGRYVMFTMAEWGTFPIYMASGDLYLLDLNTMKCVRMDINSERTDSYHCWGHDGRWFVFSSKRMDGLCARPYFCYFDQNGVASKPFVMPQKDPHFYLTFLNTYNIPELVRGRVKFDPRQLRQVVLDNKKTIAATLDPNVKPRQTKEETLYQSGVKTAK